MKTLALTGLLLLVSAPSFGQLAPYWISDDGCQKGIVNGDGLDLTLTAIAPLTLRWTPYDGTGVGYDEDWYVLDGDGDLCRTFEIWLDYTTSYDEQWREWDPPLKIIDYPLTPGKTWTSESQCLWNGQGLWRPHTLTGEVVGPTTVDTGIGQLDVMEVVIGGTALNASRSEMEQTFYLHDQLGDVTGLVSLSGCNPVAAEELSWGALKSTYR